MTGQPANPRDFSLEPGIQFYRQPGGCIEIWQTDPGAPANSNDIVHICGGDLDQFISELQAFAREVPPDPSSR